MKFFNKTVQNILILIVIIALAAAVFWLVETSSEFSLTAQASTPIPTNTFVPATFTPSSTPPPRVSFDTPAPGPTYTPAPIVVESAAVISSVIKVVDRQMLPLDQLRPLSSVSDEDVSSYALFEVVGWTEQGELVLQEQDLIERNGAYFPDTLYRVVNTVAISPSSGLVTPLSTWSPVGPAIVQGFMDSVVRGPFWVIHGYNNEGVTTLDWNTIPGWSSKQQKLASEWAAKEPITYPQYWYASSDGETVVLQVVSQKIYVLKPGHSQPIIIPKDKGDINVFITTMTAQLSPDGQRIAYGVCFDNPEIDDGYGRETDTYEIQISNLEGTDTTAIQLPFEYSYPRELAWSPDGEHIAFVAQSADHSPLHLYIGRADGSTVTDITPADFWAEGPLRWSLDGQKIVYTSGNPNEPESVGYWVASLTK